MKIELTKINHKVNKTRFRRHLRQYRKMGRCWSRTFDLLSAEDRKARGLPADKSDLLI